MENGKIAFWRTEDWEIYGPGGGGYTSSGAFGSIEGDLINWINSGSILARDALNWEYRDPSNWFGRPNFDRFSSMPTSRRRRMASAIESTNTVPLNDMYVLPAALPFNGNDDPRIQNGDAENGDIVVIGHMTHDNSSETVRYRIFDNNDLGFTDFAQTYEFLEIARRNADREAVNADFSLVGGESPSLLLALNNYRAKINQIVSQLRLSGEGAYFNLRYLLPNGSSITERIRIVELISWFERIDFQVFPDAPHGVDGFGNSGLGAVVTSNRTSLDRRDVMLRIYLSAFTSTFNQNDASRSWYIIHEIMHATLAGYEMRNRLGLGIALETRTNSLARGVAESIGLNFSDFTPGNGAPPGSIDPTPPYDPNVTVILVNPTS